MDFPTFDKNAVKPTQAITVDAPAVDPSDEASERFVEQQWIDVERSGLGATHPLSINRDSDNVTADPYSD